MRSAMEGIAIWIRARISLREACILFVIIAALFLYSIPTLTTKPRLFFDEGLFVEQAHNLATHGVLDTAVAPGVFSGVPHIANSSGISATLPLAALFKVFGFSIELARVYALGWMALFLVAAYLWVRRHFGMLEAYGSVLLIATFAPFHTNGRMSMGDIPGMTYLLISLLLLRTHVFLSGIFLGLCLVARPSVYAFAVIAVAAQVIYLHKRNSVRPLITLGTGAAIPVILELIIYLPGPLRATWWEATLLFLKKPTFGIGTSQSESILNNLLAFTHETTLIYLAVIVATIALAWWLRGRVQWERGIVFFASLYGTLGFLYFLRSPGWFKYLLPLQLILFLFLPPAISIVIDYAKRYVPVLRTLATRYLAGTAIVALALMQSVQLMYFADIYPGTDAQEVTTYVNTRMMPDDTAAFIHASQIAMFFPIEQKYSFFVVNEDLAVGKNPLEFTGANRANYIVMPSEGLTDFSSAFDAAHMRTLTDDYNLEKAIGRFNVYHLR